MHSRYALFVLVLAAAFAGVCLLSSPCSAYCVYNHTNTNLWVCGENCSKCFKSHIKSGEHGCCPGGHKGCGGETYITISPYDATGTNYYAWYVPIQVTAHGWVSIHGKCTIDVHLKEACDDLRAEVNNDHGHLIYNGRLYWSKLRYGRCRDD